MRRLVLALLVIVSALHMLPVSAQESPASVTVANWSFEVESAVKAPFFMDTVHLGALDDGREWLVVSIAATNTSDKKQELHSDKIQLRAGGEMIKQTGDESEGVAAELGGMSIGGSFPHDIEAGKTFDIVQVYKVDPDAASFSLIFDFSGEWEIPLDDLIAASSGNPRALTAAGGIAEAVAPADWMIETASYRLTLIGAAVAPTFTGAFHLGSPGGGNGWLVVTYQVQNLRGGETEVKADNHQLLVAGETEKQATEATKTVAGEIGVDMLTLELGAGQTVEVVQVFEAPLDAADYTLQISARGKLFLNLTPAVALAAGDGNAVVPSTALDLAQADTASVETNAAPTAVPPPTSVPENTAVPTEEPPATEATTDVEPTATTVDEAPESDAVEAATEESPAVQDPATLLAGRLGGTLTDVRTRFGEPSWTDAGLIGYNSVSLGGTDAILVVYYDADETVSKFSIVYLERPALFDNSPAIEAVVADVAPVDGACVDDMSVAPSWGYDVTVCVSDALETSFDAAYMQDRVLKGVPGSYSFAIDPTDDEYFEIVVQAGIDSATPPPTAIPTATAVPTAAPTLEEIYPPVVDVRDLTIGRGFSKGDPLSVGGVVQTIFVDGDLAQIQIAVAAPDDTSHWVIVFFQGDTSDVYEGTWITVYGNYYGTECFDNTFGGEVCQPAIVSDKMVK